MGGEGGGVGLVRGGTVVGGEGGEWGEDRRAHKKGSLGGGLVVK